jgi:hypothetical protein
LAVRKTSEAAMQSSILKTLAVATIGAGLFISPAAARDHAHGEYWWDRAGYSGAGADWDEYSYPGIRWYDDCRGPWRDGYRRHHGHSERHHRHGAWRYDRERGDWR